VLTSGTVEGLVADTAENWQATLLAGKGLGKKATTLSLFGVLVACVADSCAAQSGSNEVMGPANVTGARKHSRTGLDWNDSRDAGAGYSGRYWFPSATCC
jgi:hypothetical protein